MTTQEVADTLVTLCSQGKFQEEWHGSLHQMGIAAKLGSDHAATSVSSDRDHRT